jgi:hypothetical protein
MRQKLQDPTIEEDDDDMIKLLCRWYQKIIEEVPESKDWMIAAFESEIDDAVLSQRPDCSYHDLLSLTEGKGGKMLEVIQSLLTLPVDGDEYKLGVCIQLADDINDWEDDIKLNINTPVTYLINNNHPLDRYVVYTGNLIGSLPAKYNLFKPLLLLSMLHPLSNDIISEKLNSIVSPYRQIMPPNVKGDVIKGIYHLLLGDDR